MTGPTPLAARRPPSAVLRLTLGLLAGFALFQWTAAALGSDRGQAGVVVAALIVLAMLGVERVLFGQPPRVAAHRLGLGWPAARGVLCAVVVGVALLAVIPVHIAVTGAPWSPYPRWPWLLPGLFAQAGIAEEVLFRGYLFRHVRDGRPFWRAALLAMVPFVAVHLLLLLTLPWPLALASIALAAAMSFPLAYLFELGGRTIWAPAVVHFVAQGAIKVVVVPGEPGQHLPFVWIAACAVVPWVVFVVRRNGV